MKGTIEQVPFSGQRVRFLKPLLPRSQERWRAQTNYRSQTSESYSHVTAVQNVNFETDPRANFAQRLVSDSGFERHILSFTNSPSSQTVLEICIRGNGLWIYSLAFRAVPAPPHFYEVRGCGSFPSETDGNLHFELPRRLVSASQIRTGTNRSQVVVAQPSGASWVENQSNQEFSDSQTAGVLSGNSYRLGSNACLDFVRTLPDYTVAVLFKLGTAWPLRVFQRMLGLMAATSSVIPLGLLHMRPLQYWLKTCVLSHTWRLGRSRVRVTHRCVKAVVPWTTPRLFLPGDYLPPGGNWEWPPGGR